MIWVIFYIIATVATYVIFTLAGVIDFDKELEMELEASALRSALSFLWPISLTLFFVIWIGNKIVETLRTKEEKK